MTDIYFLALAKAHVGQLAAFDRRLVTNAIRGGPEVSATDRMTIGVKHERLDQKDKIREALRSLLSDIESMYVSAQSLVGSGKSEEFFGPFSVWEMDQSGFEPLASISWPNLAISMRKAREVLREAEGA